MAIIFDVTVSGATTTSYITVEEYNSYVEKQSDTTGLLSPDETTAIQKLLIAATDAVNGLLYHASGDPAVSTQNLEYPRTGETDRRGNAIPSNAIPSSLKDAVSEMAMFMHINSLNNIANDTWDDNIESVGISGTVDFSYTNSPKPSALVPNIVKTKIADITGLYPTIGMTIARG